MTETEHQVWLKIWQVEGAMRNQVLLNLLQGDKIDPPTANQVIKDQWVHSEMNSKQLDTWQKIFKYFQQSDSDKKLIRRYFKQPRTVYRGGTKTGISWTTNKSVAEWFAKRFGTEQLHQREVTGEEVAFIYNGPEKEIVLKT